MTPDVGALGPFRGLIGFLRVPEPAPAVLAGVNVPRTAAKVRCHTSRVLSAVRTWHDEGVTMTRGSHGKVQRRIVSTAELRADVERVLAEEGMTFDRFLELGRQDRLNNPRLRELWLLAGALLVGA